MAGGKISSGVIEQGGARYAGWMNNLAIVNATTTNAADSIKITGSDGTALSAANYGWVTLPSATTGRLVTLSVTADVTILITGAHWGFDTKGDLTDYLLYVYAVNDAGTLKWGVGAKPNRLIVADADDTATPASVNAYEKVLMNSALTGAADANARVIGWFKANFDDSGGAAADLWAIQTGIGDINTGSLGIEAIPMVAGYMQNIGLARVNVQTNDDSIRILGADGQSLSTTNLGWIVLPGATAGQLQVMPVSANVTIALAGAHWGLGTNGDFTDYPLHVYAINDASILKWGVGAVPGLIRIDGADDSATATDINLVDEILVNSALSASSNCREVGWFLANFDDTGGVAEDIWAIQTGAMDIMIGPAPSGLWKPCVLAPSEGFGTVGTTSYWWRKSAAILSVKGHWTNGTVAASDASIDTPSGFVINSTKYSSSVSRQQVGEYIAMRTGAATTFGSDNNRGVMFYDGSDTNTIFCAAQTDGSAQLAK